MLGAAPSALDDLAAALELRPGAVVLGVNYTAGLSPLVGHVWTQHAELALAIKRHAGRQITLHARPRDHRRPDGSWCNPAPLDQWAAVDFAWPSLHWVCGGGGISAALWARHGMGFDEVTLAGCPLEQGTGGMIAGYPDDPLPDRSIGRWQRMALEHIAAGRLAGVRSVSGWTREQLGAPA